MGLAGLVLALVGCGGDSKPAVHVNQDPPFAIDVPSGFRPAAPTDAALGGKEMRFDGPASDWLFLEWKASPESPAEHRSRAWQIKEATAEGIERVGEGDLAGGGVWLETSRKGEASVSAWLRAGDVLIECTGSGRPAVRAACKSLRPPP
ncbi:MAG: hypothetical protein KC464_11385 [Myxococcales bacterium]|nr:hypothetical protein [Myxococcales bacterium]